MCGPVLPSWTSRDAECLAFRASISSCGCGGSAQCVRFSWLACPMAYCISTTLRNPVSLHLRFSRARHNGAPVSRLLQIRVYVYKVIGDRGYSETSEFANALTVSKSEYDPPAFQSHA
eukprot:g45285.t1